MGPRGDCLLEFDWSVGEILNTLEELGLDKNTLVIISSDNGPVVDDGYKDQAVELLGDHKVVNIEVANTVFMKPEHVFLAFGDGRDRLSREYLTHCFARLTGLLPLPRC